MQLYGFTARDCDRLHALLAAYEQGRIRVDAPSGFRPSAHQQDVFLAQPTASIPAGQVGTAYLVNLDTATPTPGQTVETTLPTIPLYNSTAGALGTATIPVARENSQGYFIPVPGGTSAGAAVLGGGSQALTLAWATYGGGAGIVLPAAGTYLIWGACPVTVSVQAAAPGPANAAGWVILYDITNAVQFGPIGIGAGVNNYPSANTSFSSMASLCSTYTVAAPTTIGLQGKCWNLGGSQTFGQSLPGFLSGTVDGAWLAYLKIG